MTLDFETELIQTTDQFIKGLFQPKELSTVYHYTSPENAKLIVETQSYQASFIRSTSDPLEFSFPMTFCRDWMCLENKLVKFEEFPLKLFNEFNFDSINPPIRPYFLSVSEDSSNEALQKRFGKGVVQLIYDSKHPSTIPGMFLKCEYVRDVNNRVYTILDTWLKNVFLPISQKYNIDVLRDSKIWFYIFIKLCHSVSLAIKQNSYEEESEFRFVIFSKNPDQETDWHLPRDSKNWSQRPLDNFIKREFLPLKLSGMGVHASISK